jgi:hypothetical protein
MRRVRGIAGEITVSTRDLRCSEQTGERLGDAGHRAPTLRLLRVFDGHTQACAVDDPAFGLTVARHTIVAA